jgi:Fe-S oxidoreductase
VEPTRVEFLHIPGWQQALFYVLTFAAVGGLAWQVWGRTRLWLKGKRIDWKPDYFGSVWRYVLGQRKVQTSRPKSAAPMHLMIFYGFVALVLATTLLAVNTYSPVKFHEGLYFLIYESTFDVLGLVFVVGVVWAFFRRVSFRPPVVTHDVRDLVTLVLLFALGTSGFVLEGARMAVDPKPWDGSAPIGHLLAGAMSGLPVGGYLAIWWGHVVLVWGFFLYLPRMRFKHALLGIASAAGSPERPLGQLQPISIEEVEQTGKIGVSKAEDYSRWHLMSLDACMECGRCTEACPAYNVGKVLNPKQVVQDVIRANVSDSPVPETVTHEALWDCTTCNACVEACPVLIRHVDLIVDARRNLVAEGQLHGTAATMLRQTASSNNAWGAPASAREDWMKGLDVPLARNGAQFQWLFWVGCAGATDAGAVKTTKAAAKLLSRAGVSYACLGAEESCTGDAARRVGDEFLAQEMIGRVKETLDKYGVERIVTACPHCLNTFRHEYKHFGAELRVAHHSELLRELIDAGKLAAPKLAAGEVTYHDPCYLARANKTSDAPRAVLGQESRLDDLSVPAVAWLKDESREQVLAEPTHVGRKTLCCGAGGGRMWMEEPPDKRPGNRRAVELLSTGASTIALGCPFCRIMLDASVRQVTERDVRLADIAEILVEAQGGVDGV